MESHQHEVKTEALLDGGEKEEVSISEPKQEASADLSLSHPTTMDPPIAAATISPADPIPETSKSVVEAELQQRSGTQSPNRVLDKTDAETYLNDVKRTFAESPHVYHQFVELMKSFKAGLIITQTVIQHVAVLFDGYGDLINGFYEFLPPQYKQQHQLQQQQNSMTFQPNGEEYMMNPAAGGMMYLPQTAAGGGMMYVPQPQQQQQGFSSPSPPPPPSSAPSSSHVATQQMPQFDHAIHYVNRIKKRFQTDNDTYKQFLEILHTYQRESKSVGEVLNQVSELFKDHPDLLKDFTYFLPDNAQPQAKEEIQRITAKRKKEGRIQKQQKLPKQTANPRKKALQLSQQQLSHQQQQQQSQMMLRGPGMSLTTTTTTTQRDEGEFPPVIGHQDLCRFEARLFAELKASAPLKWPDCLKAIALFTENLINRDELLDRLGDLVDMKDWLDEFDRLLVSRSVVLDWERDVDVEYEMERIVPSYRRLSARVPWRNECSRQSKFAKTELNHEFELDVELISPPCRIKTEEEKYEQFLSACLCTMDILQAKQGELQAVHWNVLSHVYGDLLKPIRELLQKTRADAAPVVVRRLQATVENLELWKQQQQHQQQEESV